MHTYLNPRFLVELSDILITISVIHDLHGSLAVRVSLPFVASDVIEVHFVWEVQ